MVSVAGDWVLADADEASGGVFFWSVLLLVLVAAAFVAILVLRKRLSPDEDFHGDGFTLGDLRRMYKAGKMTQEEFERAKDVLLAGMNNSGASPPDELPGGQSMRSEK